MADVMTTFAAKDENFAKTIDGLQNKLGGFTKRLAGMAATFVGVQAAFSSFRAGLDMAGQLNDLSVSLGESAGNLAVLQRAFANAGAGADSVGPAISKMAKFIGDLSSGSAEAQAKAEKLGITMADLAGKSPVEQMQVLFAAIAKIPGATDRLNAGLDVFGRSALKLIPIAKDFSGGLAEARAELGSLPDILTQNAADLDHLGDKIQNSLGNKLNDFTIGLIAGITQANNLADALSKLDAAGLGKNIGDQLRMAFAAPLDTVTAYCLILLTGVKTAMNQLISASVFAGEAFKNTVSSEDYIKGLGLRFLGSLELAGNGFLRLVQEGAERLYKLFATLPGPFGSAARRDLQDIAAWQESLNAKINEANKKLEDGARLILGSVRDSVNSTEILSKDWLGVEASADSAAAALMRAQEASKAIADSSAVVSENFGSGSKAISDLLDNIRGFSLGDKGPMQKPDYFKSGEAPPKDQPTAARGVRSERSAPKTNVEKLKQQASDAAQAESMRINDRFEADMARSRMFASKGQYYASAGSMRRANQRAERSASAALLTNEARSMGFQNANQAYEDYRRKTPIRDQQSREEFTQSLQDQANAVSETLDQQKSASKKGGEQKKEGDNVLSQTAKDILAWMKENLPSNAMS